MKRTAILALTASSILALAAPAYADTLNEALAEAYRSNPTLQAARANCAPRTRMLRSRRPTDGRASPDPPR